MRSISNRTSPTRTNYSTPERSRTAEDRPQGAPANPAIADDRNAAENLPATRTDQPEAQGESLTGGGEPFQSASPVPATGTNPSDALLAGQGPFLDRDQFYRLLADQPVGSMTPSDLANRDRERHLRSFLESIRHDSAYFAASAQNGAALAQWLGAPSGAAGPRRRPAPADNPTLALSKALDLDQHFCDSPEWQHLAQAQDLPLLAKLVATSLQGTENPNLKTMLRRLVEDMAAKPPLAERVFVRLLGADESCDDRVSLGLSWAQEEWLAQPVWDGSLNHDLPKVIDIARPVLRRRLIEALAREKVEDINKVRRAANQPKHPDELETHLAYLAGLHGPLELGGEKPDANFTGFRVAGVTPEDIEKAERDVRALEGKRFWEFLATWEPWQEAVLGGLYPKEVAEIKKVLRDPDRPARLELEAATEIEKAKVDIESVPIQFRHGHITRRASQLEHEEALQLWLALTRKALSNRED